MRARNAAIRKETLPPRVEPTAPEDDETRLPADEPGTEPLPHKVAIDLPLDVRNVALTILATLAAIAAIRLAAGLLIPLVICVLVAYALSPIASAIERRRIPRWAAAGLAVGLIVGGTVIAGYWFSDQMTRAINQLPDATARIRREIRELRNPDSPMQALGEAAENLEAAAAEATGDTPPPRTPPTPAPALRLRDSLVLGPTTLMGLSGQLLLLTFFVYFLLASGDLFKRKLVRLAGPTLSRRRVTVEAIDEINAVISQFLFVLLTSSAFVMLATWAGFRAIGLPNALVLAFIGGVLNVIPYFGPLVAAGIFLLAGFLHFESIEMAMLAAGLYVTITTLEDVLLRPRVLGRAARLNNPAVFASLLFWGWLWGTWGLLLGFPILMVTKVVADRVDQLKGVGELLGE